MVLLFVGMVLSLYYNVWIYYDLNVSSQVRFLHYFSFTYVSFIAYLVVLQLFSFFSLNYVKGHHILKHVAF